jgi:6-phosphofructokinase
MMPCQQLITPFDAIFNSVRVLPHEGRSGASSTVDRVAGTRTGIRKPVHARAVQFYRAEFVQVYWAKFVQLYWTKLLIRGPFLACVSFSSSAAY